MPNGFLYAMMGLAGYYLILGNSMTRFVDASFTNAVFDKYINSRIEGVEINRELQLETIASKEFADGTYTTDFLNRLLKQLY